MPVRKILICGVVRFAKIMGKFCPYCYELLRVKFFQKEFIQEWSEYAKRLQCLRECNGVRKVTKQRLSEISPPRASLTRAAWLPHPATLLCYIE